jgi:hypothetical protein
MMKIKNDPNLSYLLRSAFMNKFKNQYPLLAALVVVFLVQLACGLGGNATEESPDYAATEAALQVTQAAIEAQPQQPEPTQETPPTPTSPPPPTDVPVVEPTQPPTPETYTSGDLIYYTDFDGGEDWEDGWVHFSIPEVDYTVYKSNGFMHVEVPDTYSAVYLIYDELFFERNYADVYVEASFQNMGTHNINNISVICRASDQGWYEFSMLSGGLWYIWKYIASNDNFILIKDGGIPDLDYDAPHSIGAECLDNDLTFYFDGEPLRNGSIKDTQFLEGQTGISVYADDWANVVVEFDYFGIAVP